MLEVRLHKAEHFACSWFGFAHRGGVSINFLFLFSVFCTHGLCVNHVHLSDVSFAHKGGVAKQMHTWAVVFNGFVYTFAKHSACKYLFSRHIRIINASTG